MSHSKPSEVHEDATVRFSERLTAVVRRLVRRRRWWWLMMGGGLSGVLAAAGWWADANQATLAGRLLAVAGGFAAGLTAWAMVAWWARQGPESPVRAAELTDAAHRLARSLAPDHAESEGDGEAILLASELLIPQSDETTPTDAALTRGLRRRACEAVWGKVVSRTPRRVVPFFATWALAGLLALGLMGLWVFTLWRHPPDVVAWQGWLSRQVASVQRLWPMSSPSPPSPRGSGGPDRESESARSGQAGSGAGAAAGAGDDANLEASAAADQAAADRLAHARRTASRLAALADAHRQLAQDAAVANAGSLAGAAGDSSSATRHGASLAQVAERLHQRRAGLHRDLANATTDADADRDPLGASLNKARGAVANPRLSPDARGSFTADAGVLAEQAQADADTLHQAAAALRQALAQPTANGEIAAADATADGTDTSAPLVAGRVERRLAPRSGPLADTAALSRHAPPAYRDLTARYFQALTEPPPDRLDQEPPP